MSSDGVNAGRRCFLVAATSVVGAAGAVGTAVPLAGSWSPSAKARAAGTPVQVNMGRIDPDQQVIVEWRGRPVFIMHRMRGMLGALPSLGGQLADPDSKVSEQPEYVDPRLRSIKPELVVIVGICIHLGCSPTLRPGVAPVDLDPSWKGDYFYSCHGSHYDLADRVYKGRPVPLNLPIPPCMFDAGDVIITGVGQEKA